MVAMPDQQECIIYYGLVAKKSVVLAEYAIPGITGNYGVITRVLLEKLSLQDGNGEVKSYLAEGWVFHCLNVHGVIFLCMTEENGGKRIPFVFLQTIKQYALKCYGLPLLQSSVEYELNTEFSPILEDQIRRVNNGEDNLQTLSSEIEKVKDNMVQNIDTLLERGERVELLVEKTESLNQNAFRFHRESKRMARAIRRKKIMVYAFLIIGVLSLLTLIIVTLCCGGLTYSKCM
eukprot:439217_1